MASWNDLLRQAREGTGLSRRALAAAAGVSEGIIESYEYARRSPRRETLLKLTQAMKLDGATTNTILTEAGLEPAPSPWLLQGRIPTRPFEALQPELDSYTWPCLALNERFEIVAWNAPAVRVAELDFAQALPLPHQRNLLRIAAMEHFRDRMLNWDTVVSVMVGMYKGHHQGSEELGEGSAYFQSVVQDILQQDSAVMGRLVALWMSTPPRLASARIVFPVSWRVRDGTELAFHCLISGWSDYHGIGVHDWHPADSATWVWLSQSS